MMRRVVLSGVIVFIILLQTGCNLSALSQGPMTWIDQPLDGTHFPLGTLTLQAHASDGDGVAEIEFFVGEDSLQTVPVGGARLGEAMIEWTPPNSGFYVIGASAVDSKGNTSPKATVQISVGDVNFTATPAPLMTQGLGHTSSPSWTPTSSGPTFTPTSSGPTFTPTTNGGPTFTFIMNANCRLGPGIIYDSIDTLYKGQTVPIQGRNTDNTWLWVLKPGTSEHCWISTGVGTSNGDWSGVPLVAAPPLPKTVTPPTIPVTKTPPPVDNTPPLISNVSINPPSIEKDGCGHPDTFTISATVTDASGVSFVTFTMQGPNPSDAIDGHLSPIGGDVYQAEIGPLESTGSWSIFVGATDTVSNNTQAGPWTIQVVCIQ